ncbi:hypothetical protein jhhlp_000552 [Lomentospora prolificans]|uniref:N-acetyltransferase domain-containing protein n=1 Tax=Lomentospora prolificans TaxID=41688 RepID=A0A2N3NL98_9PEZI|nr:hypothetical protein jhhlp_000552 [Lomentospora prolificans]
MSLPTAAKTAQSSLLSFLNQKQPKYAPPPSAPKDHKRSPAIAKDPVPPATTPPQIVTPVPPTLATIAPTVHPHPQATIRLVCADDITALRRINSLLLPVAYPDNFYQRVLDPAASALFSRVITWADDASRSPSASKVIGSIVCRVESVANVPTTVSAQVPLNSGQTLYIESLCLLSAYRSLGLASAALEEVLATVRRDPGLDIQSVYAHAWTENEEGLKWYKSRGFTCDPKPVEGYYVKLRPGSAWIVRRDVCPLSGPSSAIARKLDPAPPTAQALPLGTTARIANLGPKSTPPPPRTESGQSFQNQRPKTEWNDLPADMAPPPKTGGGVSGGSSGQSSRSSSTVRKKKDRSYPAEAFGG